MISTLTVQIIPEGATKFLRKLKMEYAPTVLPTEYGNISIVSLIEIPCKSCELSVMIPVFWSIADKKFIGDLVKSTLPVQTPPTIFLHDIVPVILFQVIVHDSFKIL